MKYIFTLLPLLFLILISLNIIHGELGGCKPGESCQRIIDDKDYQAILKDHAASNIGNTMMEREIPSIHGKIDLIDRKRRNIVNSKGKPFHRGSRKIIMLNKFRKSGKISKQSKNRVERKLRRRGWLFGKIIGKLIGKRIFLRGKRLGNRVRGKRSGRKGKDLKEKNGKKRHLAESDGTHALEEDKNDVDYDEASSYNDIDY